MRSLLLLGLCVALLSGCFAPEGSESTAPSSPTVAQPPAGTPTGCAGPGPAATSRVCNDTDLANASI